MTFWKNKTVGAKKGLPGAGGGRDEKDSGGSEMILKATTPWTQHLVMELSKSRESRAQNDVSVTVGFFGAVVYWCRSVAYRKGPTVALLSSGRGCL